MTETRRVLVPRRRNPVLALFRAALACAGLIVSAAFAAPRLNEAPAAPETWPSVRASRSASVSAATAAAAPSGYTIDLSSRERSRIFYRTVYAASEDVPIGWTGNIATGVAGTTSAAFRDAVLRRVNYFRAMAGVPATVFFDATYNAKCQAAALMMSANNDLSHTPPSTWRFYTADGAEAALKSDLFLGYAGPRAIAGYVEDFGSVNTDVGHRRWLLFPQSRTMGTGDVPGDATYNAANALWVLTPEGGAARPEVRDEFVAWPPPGFVPYTLVFPRWSFAYPGANFSSTTVSMKRGGANVAVSIQSRGAGAGENAIVWVWDGKNANLESAPGAAPTADTPVQVQVKGVVIGGVSRDFSYTVTLFDPQKAGPDTVLPVISGPDVVGVGLAAQFTSASVPAATAYQFRTASVASLTAVDGAESGTDGLIIDASNSVISGAYAASGTKSFHLTTPGFGRQSIAFSRTALISPTSQLSLKSRFGYATTSQVARVQVTLDDGLTWDDLLVLRGSGAPTAFSERTISLAKYANRTVRARCVFAYEGTGAAYPQTDENFGWYFDDLRFVNAEELSGSTASGVGTGMTTSFTAPSVGSFVVQARAQFFSEIFSEWGPVARLTTAVAQAPQIVTPPQDVDAVAGGTVQLSVSASGPGTLTYRWFRGTQELANSNAASLTFASIQPGDAGTYRVEVSNAFGTAVSRDAIVKVTIPTPVATTGTGTPLSETSVKLAGRVEAPGQTVAVGFEYGATPELGSTVSAGTASAPRDIEATLSGLAARSAVYFRAFAEVAGGTRYRGTVRVVGTTNATATLTVATEGEGKVLGVPDRELRVGQVIALTAVPAAGQYFTGWSGDATAAGALLRVTLSPSTQLVANFAPSPIYRAAGRYRGLVGSNPIAHATSGVLNITIGANGSLTATLIFGGSRFGFRGVFDAAGTARFGSGTRLSLARSGASPLLVSLQLPGGSTTPLRITGLLSDAAGLAAAIDLPRVLFTAAMNPSAPFINPPAAWVGAATAELLVSENTPIADLKGRGWSTINIARDGTALFRGATADGQRWSFSQPIGVDGSLPFYIPLYGGRGALFGPTVFAGSPLTVDGALRWFRPAAFSGARFPDGWPAGVDVTLEGGRYVPFRPGASWPLPGLATTAGNSHLWANGGGLTAEYDWTAQVALATGKVSVVPMNSGATATISFAASTGVFSGSYLASPTAAAVGWSGVLNQRASRARGFFLTPTGSGAISLFPR